MKRASRILPAALTAGLLAAALPAAAPAAAPGPPPAAAKKDSRSRPYSSKRSETRNDSRSRPRSSERPLARAASVGTWYAGRVDCSWQWSDAFNETAYGFAPTVRAANTTSGVDYQWVYWRMRVVEGGYLNPWHAKTAWGFWARAYASDVASTNTYVRDDTGGTLGTPSYQTWTYFDGGGYNTTQQVENELWFWDAAAGWSFAGYHRSVPGPHSMNIGGLGTC
jgi:hypothetical protein